MEPVTIDQLDAATSRTAESIVLDVRELGEYARGHLPGAVSIPRRVLEMRVPQLVPRRRASIVVYDSGSGRDRDTGRAVRSARTLQSFGYASAAWLRGGVATWRGARRDLVIGINVPSKALGEYVLSSDAVPVIDVATPNAGAGSVAM